MKNLKKVIAVVLCLITVFSCFSICAYAANYTSRYGNYNSPENSGDWAQYKGGKVKRSSSTTADEVRWMQAALNYCMDGEGLNVFNGYNLSKLDVDGSFGPASKKATEAFQKAAGLTVDGSFGPSTIKKMKSVLNDKKTNSLVPTTTVRRPTTSTTTTTTTKKTTTANTFKQQNILQSKADSSSNYISGDWYNYKNGKCTCKPCNKKASTNAGRHEYIQGGGCGIVSLVSAVYNLGGTIEKDKIGTAIKDVFDWGYNTKSGSQRYWQNGIKNRNFFNKADDEFGTTYGFDIDNETPGTSTDSKLINHIKNGGTAVVHVYSHFMAVVDYKVENGKQYFRVFDPAPGGGTHWNSLNRKTADGKAITTANGNWFTIDELKNDGGSKGGYYNKNNKYISYGYENIEIDAYWLISKK